METVPNEVDSDSPANKLCDVQNSELEVMIRKDLKTNHQARSYVKIWIFESRSHSKILTNLFLLVNEGLVGVCISVSVPDDRLPDSDDGLLSNFCVLPVVKAPPNCVVRSYDVTGIVVSSPCHEVLNYTTRQ